jgi:hypothetical protein
VSAGPGDLGVGLDELYTRAPYGHSLPCAVI